MTITSLCVLMLEVMGNKVMGVRLLPLMLVVYWKITGDTEIPFTDIKVPHVFIADEAYPLKKNIMRPYGKNNLGDTEEILTKDYQGLEKPSSVLLESYLLSGLS